MKKLKTLGFVKNSFVIIATLSLLTLLIMRALINEPSRISGRYHIMVERLMTDIPMYPAVNNGLAETASFYFPGPVYFFWTYNQLTGTNSVSVYKLYGVLLVIVLLGSIIFFSYHLGGSTIFSMFFTVLYFSLILYGSTFYDYLASIKPDYLLISFMLIFSYLGWRFKKNPNLVTILGILILVLIACLQKQTAIFLPIGIGLYVLFFTKLSFKWRFVATGAIAISTLMVIIIIVKIDNCLEYTVYAMASHKYRSLGVITKEWAIVISKLWLIYVPALIYVCHSWVVRKRIRNHWEKLLPWVLIWIVFLFFSILSHIKEGGNIANIELIFLSMLPVSIAGLKFLFNLDNKLICNGSIILSITIIFLNIWACRDYYIKENIKNTQFDKMEHFLNVNFFDAKTIYYSEYLPLIEQSGLLPITDTHVLYHFRDSKNERVLAAINDKYYDLFIGDTLLFDNHPILNDYKKILKLNYEPIVSCELPPLFKGKLWIPKGSNYSTLDIESIK